MTAPRIIGGVWRRTPLPVADRDGLRPTPDRVRETLFNWLGQSLDGLRVLDLFAGTGALGLEASSRGAGETILVESDRRSADSIRALIERFSNSSDERCRLAAVRTQLIADDARRVVSRLAAAGRRFDLILLDPPFAQGWIARILPLLGPLCAPDCRIYLESEVAFDPTEVPFGEPPLGISLQTVHHGHAGQVHYHLLACRTEERTDE